MYADLPKEKKIEYLKHLVAHCSLSLLHSSSIKPYLGYREAENIFCECFDAENVSRSDIAIDAIYNSIGIGIKTFTDQSDFQKIAEFDKKSRYHDMFDDLEIVREVSRMRNKRLDFVYSKYDLSNLIYHCIVRIDGAIRIYEYPMDYIDVDSIKYVSRTGNTLNFTDGKNRYKFMISKSTISMHFGLNNPLEEVPVKIMSDAMDNIVELYDNFSETTVYRLSTKDMLQMIRNFDDPAGILVNRKA